MSDPTCGCCTGPTTRTARAVENRPGLSSIETRAGRHADFLASMLAGLTDLDRPALAGLTTRDQDDYTIALLDAWAVVADVLTFYAERLAQESYLRTATERLSLQELGALLGYQLAPAVAAQTHLAFAAEPPPGEPEGSSPDPGAAPPLTPDEVLLEPGLRVQSVPAAGETPQTFEIVTSVTARPEWNALRASTRRSRVPADGDTGLFLQGSALNLRPGDVFLLAGDDIADDRWDVRILDVVRSEPDTGRTFVHWVEGLGSDSPFKLPAPSPQPYVLRKRINVFGHNAPAWGSMSSTFRGEYPGGSATLEEWPGYVISGTSGEAVDLDGSHPDVVAGSYVVLSKPTYRELWKVAVVQELTRAEFAVSGKVTRLILEDGENYAYFAGEVRGSTVFGVSEKLLLAEEDDESDVGGSTITVDGDAGAMQNGRTLLVEGTTTGGSAVTEVVAVESVSVTADGRSAIELTGPLRHVYERSTVVVYGNVALATHGESVSELLGSGNGAARFQQFALTRTPLTHLQSAESSGRSSTLTVRVNGAAWTETPTLYGRRPEDRQYAVRVDEQQRWTVRFGDGHTGSRLPTGNQNVVAEYRYGAGRAGNLGRGALTQLLDRPLGVKGVSNPAPTSGGVDAESTQDARVNIPLGVRTLGRAVSVVDYADFARAFPGVSKSHAAVLPLTGGRTIVVTVAFEPDAITDPTSRLLDLETALRSKGDPHVQVAVLPHEETNFRLAARVAVDPAWDPEVVLPAVEGAIASEFAFSRRQLGAPIHRSVVQAVIHSVTGVVAVDIDRLYSGTIPGRVDRLFAARPAVDDMGQAQPAGLLVADTDPFDSLEILR